jgi:hypothetical protein
LFLGKSAFLFCELRRFTTPTGLPNKAQGWREERAPTLGKIVTPPTTPTGLPNVMDIGPLQGRWATPLGLWCVWALPRVGAFAPTLGFVGKPRWGLDADTRHHPKYSRRRGTTVRRHRHFEYFWHSSVPLCETAAFLFASHSKQLGTKQYYRLAQIGRGCRKT